MASESFRIEKKMIRHQKYREMANFVKADFHIFQTITNRFSWSKYDENENRQRFSTDHTSRSKMVYDSFNGYVVFWML